MMQTKGNTILITGGGSGIGRALAEKFYLDGNTVIVAGRRENVLQELVSAHPGMHAMTLDIGDADNIRTFAREVASRFPKLNVIINNAGIMKAEDITSAPSFLDVSEETIAINLLGPIRLTAALLPTLQLNAQPAILTVSSGLAFVPMAMTPTYSATKAAIHSWSISLRRQLRNAGVQVIEIVPPYVQTELTGEHQASDPNAMPLGAFIDEVMDMLQSEPAAPEIIVEGCKPFRFAAENGETEAMFEAINADRH